MARKFITLDGLRAFLAKADDRFAAKGATETALTAKVDNTTFQSAINGKADKDKTEHAIAGKTAVVLKQWEE